MRKQSSNLEESRVEIIPPTVKQTVVKKPNIYHIDPTLTTTFLEQLNDPVNERVSDCFQTLPEDVIQHILLQMLDVNSLISLARTTKWWYVKLFTSDTFYHLLCESKVQFEIYLSTQI